VEGRGQKIAIAEQLLDKLNLRRLRALVAPNAVLANGVVAVKAGMESGMSARHVGGFLLRAMDGEQ
jgi:hypothetical protein